MGWRAGTVAGATAVLIALAGCTAAAPAPDPCVLEPADVANALGVAVTEVESESAGADGKVSFRCTYTDASSGQRADFSGWPGAVAIGNELEDPDGTRNPEPANVAGSPTAYFTNSGKAIRFSDGEYAYTIWIYEGDRPEGAALEELAELVLQRLDETSQ